MDEKGLIRLALIFSAVGLIALFLIAWNIEINDTTISKLDGTSSSIILSGKATKIRNGDGYSSFDLVHEEKTRIVAFSNTNLSEDTEVRVMGKQSDDGFVADRIEVIMK